MIAAKHAHNANPTPATRAAFLATIKAMIDALEARDRPSRRAAS